MSTVKVRQCECNLSHAAKVRIRDLQDYLSNQPPNDNQSPERAGVKWDCESEIQRILHGGDPAKQPDGNWAPDEADILNALGERCNLEISTS